MFFYLLVQMRRFVSILLPPIHNMLLGFWAIFPLFYSLLRQNYFLFFIMILDQEVTKLRLFVKLGFSGFGDAPEIFLKFFKAWDALLSRTVLCFNDLTVWNIKVHFFVHILFSLCWSTFWSRKLLLLGIHFFWVNFDGKITSFLQMTKSWFVCQ